MDKRYDYHHFEEEYFLHQEQVLRQKWRERVRAKAFSQRIEAEPAVLDVLKVTPRPSDPEACHGR